MRLSALRLEQVRALRDGVLELAKTSGMWPPEAGERVRAVVGDLTILLSADAPNSCTMEVMPNGKHRALVAEWPKDDSDSINVRFFRSGWWEASVVQLCQRARALNDEITLH
jgi:hypothetical protein